MRKRNEFVIQLPFALSGEQAYIAALVLEAAMRGLWHAHGDQMADFQARALPDGYNDFNGSEPYQKPVCEEDF